MLTIAELKIFIHTADNASLTKAARSLGMLPATASASLKRMERELGCRLFERSTRSMRLTPQGEIFLRKCRDALAAIDDGIAMLDAGRGEVAGTLRLSAPSDFGRNVLMPWLDEFQERHPKVGISLQCADRFIDLFRDPFDMAFRYGRLADSSCVSHGLGKNRRVVVAAPDYLERHGTPSTLADLAGHNCLLHSLDPTMSNIWRFTAKRKAVETKVFGNRISDDGAIVHAWAVAGVGLAYKSRLDVHRDLDAGRLVTLLDDLTGEDWPLRVVYPHRASISIASRALAAFIRERIAASAAGGAAA